VRIVLEAAFRRAGPVHAVAVEDGVQIDKGRELAQELPQELLGAVAGCAFADGLTSRHVENGGNSVGVPLDV
jgi:hypothetical protein